MSERLVRNRLESSSLKVTRVWMRVSAADGVETGDIMEIDISGISDGVEMWSETHLDIKSGTEIVKSVVQPQAVPRERDGLSS